MLKYFVEGKIADFITKRINEGPLLDPTKNLYGQLLTETKNFCEENFIDFDRLMEALQMKDRPKDYIKKVVYLTSYGGGPGRETNIEFITRVMDFCPYGAVGQILILHCLKESASQLSKANLDHWPDDGFINKDTWKACAVWLDAEITKRNREA